MDNFSFTRKAGVFCAVSSLPNNYGIGGFGKEAYRFIDFLAKTGQKVWQVLPLNPTAYGDSPYQSPSSMAGNPYFIDPYLLYKRGLLTKEELNSYKEPSTTVDYGKLFVSRFQMLRQAHRRFKKVGLYVRYCHENQEWLDDYALFMALKVKHNYAPWNTWEDCYKNYSMAKQLEKEFADEIDFWKFTQFMFEQMWLDVLAYAKKSGILILGDMPIYVSLDSVDVWANPENYLLDANLNPVLVAGCPPDGFSIDGQLWGNPIYNWQQMRNQNFSWWVLRFKRAVKLYDIVRIDHFRGFAGYYAVPYGEKTARMGKWYPGVGYELFKTLNQNVPNLKVVAEDLGFITDDVTLLMAQTGYPGMKMLHFAFYDEDHEYLPKNYQNSNCVVYTGTHDSDATKYWINNLKGVAKKRFNQIVPKINNNRVDDLILFAHKSIANLSMVPLIDYLHLGNEARMNVPATSQGNWAYRLKPNYNRKTVVNRIYNLTKLGDRL